MIAKMEDTYSCEHGALLISQLINAVRITTDQRVVRGTLEQAREKRVGVFGKIRGL